MGNTRTDVKYNTLFMGRNQAILAVEMTDIQQIPVHRSEMAEHVPSQIRYSGAQTQALRNPIPVSSA